MTVCTGVFKATKSVVQDYLLIPAFLQASSVSTMNNKLIVDSQLCAHVYISSSFHRKKRHLEVALYVTYRNHDKIG